MKKTAIYGALSDLGNYCTEKEVETMKHTPGPWKYEQSTKTIRATPSNYWLATMDSWDGAVNHDANAKLIAAAPELLEALSMLLDRLDYHGNIDIVREEGPIEDARQAIEKATV
jgi:hypothetical protein